MFKPKKEDPATKNKTVMPMENGMPKSAVIRKQLDEAAGRRGMIVEQAWTTSKPNQKFILMCQWDKAADNPVWTLYEENSQESKMHFSQQFDSKDFAMMYDVICMSAPDGGSAGIPDALKPHQEQRKSDPYPGPSSYGGPSPSPSPSPYPTAPSPAPSPYPTAPSPSPYGGGSPYPSPPGATPYPALSTATGSLPCTAGDTISSLPTTAGSLPGTTGGTIQRATAGTTTGTVQCTASAAATAAL